MHKLIAAAVPGCGKITVIRVDGRPSVVASVVFGTGAKTQQNFDADQAHFLAHVDDLIDSATAREPESNDLQALSLASGAAGEGGTAVLIDSGVQTTTPLDLRTNNLPSRRPDAVVAALKAQQLLPSLSGRSVILSGIGYTAAPQPALADKDRTFLIDLWRGIVITAGARPPLVIGDPNTNESAVASPGVGVVAFPAATV
ncbi:MAG: hypothetical protein ABI140_17350, partial [Jatrophihabitantaceae bacterium]